MSNWINVETSLPKGAGDIVKVKRKNGDEIKAYYHRDSMIWLSYYCKEKTSQFQDYHTRRFLQDVTHWRLLSDTEKKE